MGNSGQNLYARVRLSDLFICADMLDMTLESTSYYRAYRNGEHIVSNEV